METGKRLMQSTLCLGEPNALRFGDGESLKHWKISLPHSDLLEAGLKLKSRTLRGKSWPKCSMTFARSQKRTMATRSGGRVLGKSVFCGRPCGLAKATGGTVRKFPCLKPEKTPIVWHCRSADHEA
jgi:hypothetical protein